MRVIKLLLIATAMSISLPKVAHATFYTGNELLKFCTAERSQNTYYQETAHCAGFIVGAVDANELHRLASGVPACLPQTVTIRQITDTVVAYLAANPAKRHLDASLLVQVAVIEAFGCNAKS